MPKNEHLRALVPEDSGASRPVSELTLFPNRPAYWKQVDHFGGELQGNLSKSHTIQTALHKLEQKSETSLNRLKEKMQDVRGEYSNISSSVTVGNAYLQIHKDLSLIGVSDQDINDFFLTCLRINTQSSEAEIGSSNEELMRSANLDAGSIRRLEGGAANTWDFLVTQIPIKDWYPGSAHNWVNFVFEKSFFAYLLHPDAFVVAARRGGLASYSPKKLLNVPREATFAKAYPDWVGRINQEDFSREDVRNELFADEGILKHHREMYDSLVRQREAVLTSLTSKDIKARRHFQGLRREILEKITSFSDLILYLSEAEEFVDDSEVMMDCEPSNPQDRSAYYLRKIPTPQETKERVVNDFLDKNPYQAELLALWFERKMHEGGVGSIKDTVDPVFVGILSETEEGRQGKMQELRVINKKTHDAIKFGIIPLLDELGQDDKDYLSSYASEGAISYDALIMELAEILSMKISRDGTSPTSTEFIKRDAEFKKFAKNIILNNYKWFMKEMGKAKDGDVIKPAAMTELENGDTASTSISDELNKEAEIRERENSESNIGEWGVYYARKKQVDQEHLVKLDGDTLEQLEESLKDYMARDGISFPVKISSAINALDDYVGLDEEELQRRLRGGMVINGEVFHKIKRGRDGRIFAQIDSNKKELRFFLYGKTGYNYDFPHTNL